MRQRATELFPFGIALVLPPVGFILGLFAMEEDRDLGLRICVFAVIGALIWTIALVS